MNNLKEIKQDLIRRIGYGLMLSDKVALIKGITEGIFLVLDNEDKDLAGLVSYIKISNDYESIHYFTNKQFAEEFPVYTPETKAEFRELYIII